MGRELGEGGGDVGVVHEAEDVGGAEGALHVEGEEEGLGVLAQPEQVLQRLLLAHWK